MELEDLRKQIDRVNVKILRLLEERLLIVTKIAEIKEKENLKISDSKREAEILDTISSLSKKEFRRYVDFLFSFIISFSKILQLELNSYSSFPLNAVFSKEAFDYDNFLISFFGNNLEIFNYSRFSQFAIKKTSSILEALEDVFYFKSDIAIVETFKLDLDIFNLSEQYFLYVVDVLKLKNKKYIFFSRDLIFKKEYNRLVLVVKIEDYSNNFVNLIMVLIVNYLVILDFNLVKRDGKNVEILLQLSCSFKKNEDILKFIKILGFFVSKFKILGFYREENYS